MVHQPLITSKSQFSSLIEPPCLSYQTYSMYKNVLAAAAQQFPDSGEFFGTIDGHDLIAPIKVMGILFVERAFAGEHGESRVHGCYTVCAL